MRRELLTNSMTIIFALISSLVFGQTKNHKTKNLSYHIVGVIGNIPEAGGTGFFIKKDQSYYLVSAWHCFSFKNHLTGVWQNKKSQLIKEIIVYRDLEDIRTNNYSRVQLTDSTAQHPTYLSVYQNENLLDISAIPVKRQPPFEFDYYDVDNERTNMETKVGESVFYYGFPIKNGKQSNTVELFEGKISEMNINELTMDLVGFTGCSGAPLFVKKGHSEYLWGVLFYALKDTTGRGEKCKAVDLRTLIDML